MNRSTSPRAPVEDPRGVRARPAGLALPPGAIEPATHSAYLGYPILRHISWRIAFGRPNQLHPFSDQFVHSKGASLRTIGPPRIDPAPPPRIDRVHNRSCIRSYTAINRSRQSQSQSRRKRRARVRPRPRRTTTAHQVSLVHPWSGLALPHRLAPCLVSRPLCETAKDGWTDRAPLSPSTSFFPTPHESSA